MKRYILDITPQTWVRINAGKHGDQVLFKVPEACTAGDDGGPCEDRINNGKCKHALSDASIKRKRRIEKYNKYRLDLFHVAKTAGFMLPVCGWAVYFYFPMPKRWPKQKKAQMHGQFHMQKPDQSNLLKAFEDALAITDENISQMSGLGKFWIDAEKGYIEILTGLDIYNPFSVSLDAINKSVEMTDLQTRREEKARKKREAKELNKKNKEKAKPKPLRISEEVLFKKKDNLL